MRMTCAFLVVLIHTLRTNMYNMVVHVLASTPQISLKGLTRCLTLIHAQIIHDGGPQIFITTWAPPCVCDLAFVTLKGHGCFLNVR